MTRGYEDYLTRFIKSEVTLRPQLLFKTGSVIYTDNFDYPNLAWETGGVGTEIVELLTTNIFTSPACVHLRTDGAANDTAYIQKRLGIAVGEKVGVELAFYVFGADGIYYFEIEYYNGEDHYLCGIKHTTSDTTWKYKNSAGNYVDLTPPTKFIYIAGDVYHRLKLIVDFSTGKYLKLYVDGQLWNIPALTMQSAGLPAAQRLEVKFTVEASAIMTYPHMYIDNVAITEED